MAARRPTPSVDGVPPLEEVTQPGPVAPAADAVRQETATSAASNAPPVSAPSGYAGPVMLHAEARAGYVLAFQKIGTKAFWPAAWLANDHRLVTVMEGPPGQSLAEEFVAMGEVFGWFRDADDPRWAAALSFVMTAGGVFAFSQTLPPEPPMRGKKDQAPKDSEPAAPPAQSDAPGKGSGA